ncbi:fimbria/pilus outer membrane usher protein [Pseudomonas shahriarae]|uniref:fimbria/pilus outer membrane usher protein n=1 Tax=Pseudomonas shahriarae TaxID=2745512 RepID=UPI00249AFC7E|nr:fimbria/pilus outer membrane usher protein [Pseudomonas shahriarae]MDI3205490.1 fimbria/pilus outer membrane usher protein [Pseudomonas shahriarae]
MNTLFDSWAEVARYFSASRLSKPVVGWWLALGMSCGQKVFADEVLFNRAFLPEGSESLDLAPFQKGNAVLPGQYRADVFVNEQPIGRKNILFSASGGGVLPCFTAQLLDELGVSPKAYLTPLGDPSCLVLPETVRGASATFNLQDLMLRVSVPQVALRRDAQGYVSPELWNRGTTAAIFGYSANATRNLKGHGEDSAYLSFDAGINLSHWRARHNGSVSWQPTDGAAYQALNTYLQRDLAGLKSQLTLGETHTTGELFDGVPYRGVQLATDDRMLPQSLRGYAPMIRGIARTSARVVIRQESNILREILVAPGPFVIDDLYSSGYGGDLSVTVIEADGSQQRFTVPYASVSQLLRPGVSRYSLTAGQLRNQYLDDPPNFTQATVQHGLNNMFTGEGGLQASDKYTALLTGVAMNTQLGALALDLTQSKTRFLSGTEHGNTLRLLYSKSVLETGSYFTAASYWYSATGAHNLNDASQRLQFEKNVLSSMTLASRMSRRVTLSANQQIGEWGQLGLSASSQWYRSTAGSDLQYQLSYSTRLGRVGLSLNANRSRQALGAMDTTYLLTANLPLAFGSTRHYAQLSARLARDAQGQLSEDLYLSGSSGEGNQYSYGVGLQRDGASGTSGTSWNGQYQGDKTSLGGSLSQGDDYATLGVSVGGSLVGHPKGLTLSPFRSDTIALISAKGAQGAEVVGFPGVKLDGQGNAVVPYLRPYELNEVGIDPRGASSSVDLNESSRKVVPTAGAVLAVDFATNAGRALLLTVHLADGSPVPFGATVSLAAGPSLGLVGQGGQLYARVPEGVDQVRVSWGREATQQCLLLLPAPDAEGSGLQSRNSLCTAVQP